MNHLSSTAQPGRNDPCPCGSGKKYKKCCGIRAASPGQKSSTSEFFRQAQALMQKGRWNQAIQLYEKILSINSNHTDAMHYMGLCYLERGDNEQALQWVERSISLRPGEVLYLGNYGVLLEQLGDIDTAEKYFRKALGIDPGNHDARFNLGRILVRQQKSKEAIDHLKVLNAQLPNDTEVLCYLAQANEITGNWPKALSYYNQALK
ncbi:MAG: tetratricopeptide repeat protein, partial [Gammaproteobacteria bacterium]|nr:tetratricopeptide repeat protein [Gammaproteobacteria bacterium]